MEIFIYDNIGFKNIITGSFNQIQFYNSPFIIGITNVLWLLTVLFI